MSKTKLTRNSAAEEAAIEAGIRTDPDTYVMSDEEFSQAAAEKRHRGRPVGSVAEVTKKPVTIRLDPDLVEAMRSSGPGWQTRANEVLRQGFLSPK